jgi:hypothetical protein
VLRLLAMLLVFCQDSSGSSYAQPNSALHIVAYACSDQ